MKRKYMIVCGFICLVFAYANVLAGKMVLGYLCGMSSLMIGFFLLYVFGIFEIRVQHLFVHIPFVWGCYLLMKMPYEVGNDLAIVSLMTVGYSLMVQMLYKDLRMVERKYVSKYMVFGGLLIFILCLVSMLVLSISFEWVLIGNDWMMITDALQMELLSMGVLVGTFFVQGVYSLFCLHNRVVMNSY